MKGISDRRFLEPQGDRVFQYDCVPLGPTTSIPTPCMFDIPQVDAIWLSEWGPDDHLDHPQHPVDPQHPQHPLHPEHPAAACNVTKSVPEKG